MKTSIIIPVMNDSFVFKCLNEIIKTLGGKIPKDKEIIVVNDKKSNEKFSFELEKFCSEKKVRYFRAGKAGASFNRNKGMKISKGKNILFIDSDCFPEKNWIPEMEKSLKDYDIVEGRISYDSKDKPLFDRVVENKSTQFRFLTANLGIKREVGEKCKFDSRFIVFREDTDFGLSAIEKGFKPTFNQNAEVFHKKSRFTIKKFILERKRYVGEPLLFKKHNLNPLLKQHIPRIWRISHPIELFLLLIILGSLFFSWEFFLIAYFIPGLIYSLKQYLVYRRNFSFKDSLLILFFIPPTIIVKRIYIWKGALKFKVLLI